MSTMTAGKVILVRGAHWGLAALVIGAGLCACGGGTTGGGSDGGAGSGADLATAGASPKAYAGSWSGTWNNTTFGSTGAAKCAITVDEGTKKVTFKLDLDGNVFGAADPPEETFTGSYDATGFTLTGNSATFPNLALTIAANGTISGSAKPPRGDVTLSGTATATKMTINYTIKDAPNPDIKGVLTLNKS